MTLRPLGALVAKDLRVFFADRYALILSVAAPIALASFMAMIFGGAGDATPARIAVILVDRDGGPIARAIVAGARAEPRLDVATADLEPALLDVRRQRAVVAVEIPEGFGDRAAGAMLGDNEPAELRFHLDPTHRPEVSMTQGLLTRTVLEAVANDAKSLTGGWLDDLVPGRETDPPLESESAIGPAGDRPGPHAEERQTRPRPPLRMPYRTRDVSILSGDGGGDRAALAAHAFAAMTVQFVLFLAVEWGVGLLVERRRGLWKRLRSAPVSMATLLASKVAGGFLAASLVIGLVFAAGAILFGFRVRGSIPGLVLMGAAFAWMASNFGLMVAALGRSPQGARSVSILAVLVMVLLGGGWIPGFLFPAWLQTATLVMPTRWAIDGFDGLISRGYALGEAVPTLALLAAAGVGFGAVALGNMAQVEPD
jgi:ABC-2 type transport system permease protein